MWPVVLWWTLLEGLGLVALPLCFALFAPGSAHGYGFAKILAPLLLAYVSWIAGFVVPMPAALTATLLLLIAASGTAAWLQRTALRDWLAGGGLRTLVRLDLLWTAGFLFFAWQRSLAPDIHGAEKYMDFAFFNALVRTDTMPPPDPWMSGESINYYYFGYLMFADLARLVPLPAAISYNLSVATVGGLAFAETSAVVLALTRRWALAVFGGVLSAVAANLDGFLQLVEKGTVRGMDYWRSSRVVDRGDTINEFPFFSTIHGDLHPHFIVLPVSLALLGMLLDERLFPSRPEGQPRGPRALVPFGLVAFVLGAMIAISVWELPMGLLVVALLAGRWQSLQPLFSRERMLLLARVGGTLIAGYLLFLPFHMSFEPPTVAPGPNEVCIGPACFAIARTSLAQFLTVFGLLLFPPALLATPRAWRAIPGGGGEFRHLLLATAGLAVLFAAMAGNAVLPLTAALLAAALIAAYAEPAGENRAGFLLVAAASAALVACETVYLKDSYGDKLYRMNTVFKLYFQAWTILAVATAWSTHRLLQDHAAGSPVRRFVTASLTLLVGASLCYPLGITLDRMGNPFRTLDGNAYLERHHADDYAAIRWLRDNLDGQQVILEATGNPYSYFARFSSNTGLPTVLGWANHEGLWRKGNQEVGTRSGDVARIYNAPSLAEVEALLDRYGVEYVLVGQLEREHYKPEGLDKFGSLEVVFRHGQTTVYKR
jgi:YYY domain-containing protein